MNNKTLKTKKGGVTQTTSVPVYPATIRGEARLVSVPGSEPKERGPETEAQFRTFLVDSIEGCAEMENMDRPVFRPIPSDKALARDAGLTDDEVGVVICFGTNKYLVRISKLEG